MPNTHASVSWHTGGSGKECVSGKGAEIWYRCARSRSMALRTQPIPRSGTTFTCLVPGQWRCEAAHPENQHTSPHLITYPHTTSFLLPHLTSQTRRVLPRSSTSEANTFSTTLITNFWHHFTIRGEVGNAKASVYHLESRNSPVAKTSYYPPIEPTPSQVSLQLYFT